MCRCLRMSVCVCTQTCTLSIHNNSTCSFIKDKRFESETVKVVSIQGKNLTDTMQLTSLPWVKLIKPQLAHLQNPCCLSLSASQAVYTAWTVIVSVVICLSLCSNFLFTGDAYIPHSEHSSLVGEGSGVVYLE